VIKINEHDIFFVQPHRGVCKLCDVNSVMPFRCLALGGINSSSSSSSSSGAPHRHAMRLRPVLARREARSLDGASSFGSVVHS
jgi:hypothetical protein